jgi:hypothetical protein
VSGRCDAAARLERALVQAAGFAGVAAAVTDAGWTRWASATFTGARHKFELEVVPSPQVDGWLAALPEHEFALTGHLVADLVVTAVRAGDAMQVSIEALTVEDR